jgi:hypothetical protein
LRNDSDAMGEECGSPGPPAGFRRGVPVGQALPFMRSGSEANWGRNQVTASKSALPPTIPPLERAVELCRVAQARVLFDITAAQLGYAYAVSGRLPEGVILMEEPQATDLADSATSGPHRWRGAPPEGWPPWRRRPGG